MICVQMRHECWTAREVFHAAHEYLFAKTNQLQKANHTCMPGCECILAFTAADSSLCMDFVCGIRSWKYHVWWFLEMKELLDLLQTCWVGRKGPIPWPGRLWFYSTRLRFLRICHRTHLYWTIWHSADGKTHWNWTCFETCFGLTLYTA